MTDEDLISQLKDLANQLDETSHVQGYTKSILFSLIGALRMGYQADLCGHVMAWTERTLRTIKQIQGN